jgi:transcription antitermination factor NusG
MVEGLLPALTGPASGRDLIGFMSQWICARASPNSMGLACRSVAENGFETFVPKTREKVGVRWKSVPLFGLYFFVRIDRQWRAVERSAGVNIVVKFGAAPAEVPPGEIKRLLELADEDGIVRLPHRRPRRNGHAIFEPGAAVTITAGAFSGFEAIVQGMSAGDRLLVLMHVLGGPTKVEIAAGLIAAR